MFATPFEFVVKVRVAIWLLGLAKFPLWVIRTRTARPAVAGVLVSVKVTSWPSVTSAPFVMDTVGGGRSSSSTSAVPELAVPCTV